jgi:large subunit ribosomal protein L3
MAKKVGMTQIFDETGNLVPVTVLHVEPNTVVRKITAEKDGYNAVVLGIDEMKKSHIKKPYQGQFTEQVSPKKQLKEVRDFDAECEVGANLGVEVFEKCRYVDVAGISKGKGFQGVMKRWNFGGGRHTHGSKFHREPGSTGQSTYPHKTFKNVQLPGRMGSEKTTVLNLRVIKIDKEKQLLMVKGAVPGVDRRTVVVRASVKKQG